MLGSNTAPAISRTSSKNVPCECSQAQGNGSGGPPPSSAVGSNPVCATGALWTQPGAGKLAVLGSAEMFDDAWLDREDNARVMDWVFRWLRRVRATSCLLCVAQHSRCKDDRASAVLALCALLQSSASAPGPHRQHQAEAHWKCARNRCTRTCPLWEYPVATGFVIPAVLSCASAPWAWQQHAPAYTLTKCLVYLQGHRVCMSLECIPVD